MVPPEALESRDRVRAASLAVVLILAKVLAIAGRDVPLSVWTVPAFIWQDVAVGAAFWAIDIVLRRPRAMWALYFAVVAYAAVNVPIARVLSSPLTVPMWRAARGPLFDSIAYYATAQNLSLIAAVVISGVLLPNVLRRMPRRARAAATVVAMATSLAGPAALARVPTLGAHRNAVTALLATATPRIAARAAAGEWRTSPFQQRIGENLSDLSGLAARRHVVLVSLESTAAQYLRFHGAADDPTPALSLFASQSIVFDNAYAVYPESIKGLFSILCARHPAFDMSAEAHAAAPCEPLPDVLSQAGYRTGLFHSGRFDYLGMRELIGRQRFGTAEDAGAIGANARSSFGVDEPSTVRRLLQWIDDGPAGRPFFLAYLPVAGHHPYFAHSRGPFADAGELGAYKNALHDGDRAFLMLLHGLRSRGLMERTLFVVFGDHGEAFGQHAGNHGHSLFIFDENIRVPLVVSLPGLERARGVRVSRVASLIDVAPTILDLLGLGTPSTYEGVSLLPPADRMALFFTDYSLGWLGLRDGCWKYQLEVESHRSHLFDVCVDPGETTDRSADEPERVARYRERVERWSSAQRAALGR